MSPMWAGYSTKLISKTIISVERINLYYLSNSFHVQQIKFFALIEVTEIIIETLYTLKQMKNCVNIYRSPSLPLKCLHGEPIIQLAITPR